MSEFIHFMVHVVVFIVGFGAGWFFCWQHYSYFWEDISKTNRYKIALEQICSAIKYKADIPSNEIVIYEIAEQALDKINARFK